MAITGNVLGSFAGTSTSNARPIIEYSYTQNLTNNTSTITASLVFYRYNPNFKSYDLIHTATFNLAGSTLTERKPFDLRNTDRYVLWTRTRTVTHNSDGKLTVVMGASGDTSGSLQTYNFSGNVVLEQIGRASSVSFSNTNLDSTISGTITRESNTFTHDLALYYGSGGSGSADWLAEWYAGSTKTPLTSFNLTITTVIKNRILDKMKTRTSGTLRMRCRTYSGTTLIGTTYDTFTMTIPNNDSYRPTIGSLTPSVSGSGADNSMGRYVQGISRASVSYEYYINGRADLKSVNLTVDGTSYGSSMPITSNVLTKSGNRIVKLVVEDSRGRKATEEKTINVNAYSSPSISLFSAHRTGATTSVMSEWEGTTTSLGGNNSITIRLRRRLMASTSYTTLNTWNFSAGTTFSDYYFDSVPATNSYEYRLEVTDSFNTSHATHTVGTGKKPLTISKEGIGVGKIWERGALDVNGDVYLDGTLITSKFAATSHNHSASNINSGTLSYLRLPRGTTSTTVATGNHSHLMGTTYTLSLVNGWEGNIRYRKNNNGIVEVEGSLNPGTTTSGTTIATLPTGYRPSQMISMAVYDSWQGVAHVGIIISTNGTIVIRKPMDAVSNLTTVRIYQLFYAS